MSMSQSLTGFSGNSGLRTVASGGRGVVGPTTPVPLDSGDIFNRLLLNGKAWQVPLANLERALCYAF